MPQPTIDAIFWSLQDEIRVLLVEAMNEAVIITGLPESRSTSLAVDDALTIQTLPEEMLCLVSLQVAGVTIPKMKVDKLDKANPGWQNETGATLKGWFPFGLGKFGVYPQLTAPATATVGYIPQPVIADRPYTGAEDVDFPIEYFDAFMQYASGMARLKEGGFETQQGIQTLQSGFLDPITALSSFAYRMDSLRLTRALGAAAEINSVVKK